MNPDTDTPEEEPCTHDEHDHGICLSCGKDINDDLQAAADALLDSIKDRELESR